MDKSKLLPVILAVLVLGLGWYLLSDNAASDNSRTATVYNDSIPDPERPVFTARQDTVEQDSTPPRAGEELAPGTALIRATVVAVDFESKANRKLRITAEEILGYGSSTSPIGAPQEMIIKAERYLKGNPGHAELLQKGKTVLMVVSAEEEMSLGDSRGGKDWSLVEIKSQ